MAERSWSSAVGDLSVAAFIDTGDPTALERWKREHPDWFVAGYCTPGPRCLRPAADRDRGFAVTGRGPGEVRHALGFEAMDPESLSLADFREVAEAARRGAQTGSGLQTIQYYGAERDATEAEGPLRTPSEEFRELRYYDALRTLRRLEPRNPEGVILRDPARVPSEEVVQRLEQEAAGAIARAADRAVPSGPGEPDPATPFQQGELRREMVREGFMSEEQGYDAHHLVPGGGRMSGNRDPRRSQEMLQEFGIELNSALNGVAHSRRFHNRLHTEAYYRYVQRGLQAARSREDAIRFLRGLAGRLRQEDLRFQQDGKMPTWQE